MVLGGATIVSAEQWQIVGPRALGMGGAHVAVVNDASASYWNPAVYGFFGRRTEKKDEHSERKWGVHVHGGAGVQVHEDVIKEVDDVLEFDFNALAGRAAAGILEPADFGELIQLIAEVRDLEQEGIGLIATVDAGLSIRYKNFGIGAYNLGEIAATDPLVDTANLGIYEADPTQAINNLIIGAAPSSEVLTNAQRTQVINAVAELSMWNTANAEAYANNIDNALSEAGVESASEDIVDAAIEMAKAANDIVENPKGGGRLQDNNSNILFQGASVFEIPITYGYAFNDNFSVGGNLKFMRARVYFARKSVYDQEADDFLEEVYDDYEESDNFGVDLGGLFKYKAVRLGLVGRNLNSPQFDYAGPGNYEIEPQLRAGIAYIPADWMTIAADVDITENDTPMINYDSQNLGGGIELRVWDFLSLRSGAYTNLAESTGDEVVYTAGLGIDILGFNLDVGAAATDSKTEFDGRELPEQARIELALSLQY